MSEKLTRLVLQEKDHTIQRLEASNAALLAVAKEMLLYVADSEPGVKPGVLIRWMQTVKDAESGQPSSGEGT